MAQRRMLSLKIIDTDKFLEMPISARCLYYDLSMRADDEGFVSSPKKIILMIGASTDDFKLLCAKDYIIPFESGIVVIKDWRVHNYIQNDRFQETHFKIERKSLSLSEEGMYTKCIQDVSKMDTQDRIGKDRIGKDSIEIGNIEKIPPSIEEISSYIQESSYSVDATRFFDFYESKGWMVGKNKMKSWKAAVRTWERSNTKVDTLTPAQKRNAERYRQFDLKTGGNDE